MLCLASLTQVFEGRYKWVMLSCHTPLVHLPVPRSVTPMGSVTKYLQKLGMGVYNNENQPKSIIFHRLLGLYGDSLPRNETLALYGR